MFGESKFVKCNKVACEGQITYYYESWGELFRYAIEASMKLGVILDFERSWKGNEQSNKDSMKLWSSIKNEEYEGEAKEASC